MRLHLGLALGTGDREIGRTRPAATLATLPAVPQIPHLTNLATIADRLGTASFAKVASQTGVAHVKHIGRSKGTLPATAVLSTSPSLRWTPACLSQDGRSGTASRLRLAARLAAKLSLAPLRGFGRGFFRMKGKLRANVHGNGLRDAPSLTAAAIPQGAVGLQGRGMAGRPCLALDLRLNAGLAGLCAGLVSLCQCPLRRRLRPSCHFLPALVLCGLRRLGSLGSLFSVGA